MEINNSFIKENYELRAMAREQLKGHWGMALLLCLVYSILGGIFGFIPYVGPIINLVLIGPLTLGLTCCFMKLVRNEEFIFENLFDGFKNFAQSFILQLLSAIFISLWTLLLIVPGIIATYKYSMAFYILNDNPEIDSMDAINRSKEMMNGYKWKLFCLHLSFIGWWLLSILTLGIGFLWLIPYIKSSTANFYENLRQSQINSEFTTSNTDL